MFPFVIKKKKKKKNGTLQMISYQKELIFTCL